VNLAPAGEAVLAFTLAVAFGALLRRTLPAIGAALAGFTILLLAARWTVQALTPASKTTGPDFTAPPGSWILGSGTNAPVPYHPAGQYWPLQLILLTVLLALAAAAPPPAPAPPTRHQPNTGPAPRPPPTTTPPATTRVRSPRQATAVSSR